MVLNAQDSDCEDDNDNNGNDNNLAQVGAEIAVAFARRAAVTAIRESSSSGGGGGGGESSGPGNGVSEFLQYHRRAAAQRAARLRDVTAAAKTRQEALARPGARGIGISYNLMFCGWDLDIVYGINDCAARLHAVQPEASLCTDVTIDLANALEEIHNLLTRGKEQHGDEYTPLIAQRENLLLLVNAARAAYVRVLLSPSSHEGNVRTFCKRAGAAGAAVLACGLPENAQTLRDMLLENLGEMDNMLAATANDSDSVRPECCVCLGEKSECNDITGHELVFVDNVPRARDGQPVCGHGSCTRQPSEGPACGCVPHANDPDSAGGLLHLNCLSSMLWRAYAAKYLRGPVEDDKPVGLAEFPRTQCPLCTNPVCIGQLRAIQM